jgi:tRNA threonylcarbamoyladenosine biosynthesis protein TsaB
MYILGFDTATRATTVALLDLRSGSAIEHRDDPPAGARPRHTTRLMGLITEVMAEAGAGWGELERIAVGVGPGTFTGLRIGVATARALAGARGIALVPVSTLDALALGAAERSRPVLAVIDARRGEVFAAGWPVPDPASSPGALPDPVLAPCAIAPEALGDAAAALSAGWLAVGDGAVEFRAVLERSGALIPRDQSPSHRVSAVEHCRLAQGSDPVAREDVRPRYLRLPDAELALRAGHQR